MKSFDVIIVGAGLVGLSAALALQSTGLRVLVMDKNPLPDPSAEERDPRPISLALGTQRVLSGWGLWEKLAPHACPIDALHISEQGQFGQINFSSEQMEVPALGYVVPYHLLHLCLAEKRNENPQATFLHIQEIVSLNATEQAVDLVVRTEGGELPLQANLLIAADGSHSVCRQLLNVSCEMESKDEIAIIGDISFEKNSCNTAYQRFTQQGILALLPTPKSHTDGFRFVWSVSKVHYESLKHLSDHEIGQTVASAMGYRLGRVGACRITGQFPLQQSKAERSVLPGVVLLGNAAMTLYPYAAQGFNLNLHCVVELAKALVLASDHGRAIGSLETLKHYQSAVENRLHSTRQFTRHLAVGFKSSGVYGSLGLLRGMGMLAIDMCPSIKSQLAKRLMHV